jgi:RhoGAP domain
MLRQMFALVPDVNAEMLFFLFKALHEVAEHSEQNRMSLTNLATLFAPILLREQEFTMENMHESQVLCTPLLNN